MTFGSYGHMIFSALVNFHNEVGLSIDFDSNFYHGNHLPWLPVIHDCEPKNRFTMLFERVPSFSST
jgi:hypothetical protein